MVTDILRQIPYQITEDFPINYYNPCELKYSEFFISRSINADEFEIIFTYNAGDMWGIKFDETIWWLVDSPMKQVTIDDVLHFVNSIQLQEKDKKEATEET